MNDAQRIGANLRRSRRELGWSLADAQRSSSGNFSAVVIGSYERGDRNITAVRLLELSSLYGLSPMQLIGQEGEGGDRWASADGDAVTLNLEKLRVLQGDDGDFGDIERLARTVITRRGDFNGTLLSLRRHDLQTLAAARGTSTDALVTSLAAAGVVHEV